MKKDICIIAAAQGIHKKVIERFRSSIKYSSPKYNYDIMIKGGNDKKFYKTRIINHCLRKAIPKYKVIIQTDIDLIIPPNLINRTFEDLQNQSSNCFHHFLRYIEPQEIKDKFYKSYPWQSWRNLKSVLCSGCWNGMTSETWTKSGGFNEDMFAWGSEDTEFYNRTKRKGIHWMNCLDYPLMHINHNSRQPKRAKQNFEVAKLYSDETNWITGKIIKVKG